MDVLIDASVTCSRPYLWRHIMSEFLLLRRAKGNNNRATAEKTTRYSLRRKGKTKLNQFQAFLFSSLSPISISLFSLSLCRFSFIVQRHKINTPSLTFSVHFYWAISRVKRNPNRRYNTVLAINSCLSVSPLHCSGLEQENRHNIVCIVHDNWPSSHRRFPWHVSSISLSLSHLRACNVSNTASLR